MILVTWVPIHLTMIGTSRSEYCLIRLCIFLLHWLPLLAIIPCLIYFALDLSWATARRLLPLEIYTLIEICFCLFIFLPRKHYLQAPAVYPEKLSRLQRSSLFTKCTTHIPNIDHYITKWFLDGVDVRRENVKEFLRWAILDSGDAESVNKPQPSHANGLASEADPLIPSRPAEDDEELEEYVALIEQKFDRSFAPGRGSAKCLRLNVDAVDMRYRPVLWYLIVWIVDTVTSVQLFYNGFRFFRAPHNFPSLPAVFPPRPTQALSPHISSSSTLTYWLRPHTSQNHRPVVFLHGIGIGLWTYTSFFASLDPSIGVLALELLPISFRLTPSFPPRARFLAELSQILSSLGPEWRNFVLTTHSYGSVLATHIIHDPALAPRVGAILMVDPVSLLLHLPDVAYNFTARIPRRANEWELWYFASKDMMVAHTLHRGFFWKENLVWKEELEEGGRKVTVALAGQDQILPSATVRDYLGGAAEKWRGEGLEVLWFEELDHAQVFERGTFRDQLVNVVAQYCVK